MGAWWTVGTMTVIVLEHYPKWRRVLVHCIAGLEQQREVVDCCVRGISKTGRSSLAASKRTPDRGVAWLFDDLE